MQNAAKRAHTIQQQPPSYAQAVGTYPSAGDVLPPGAGTRNHANTNPQTSQGNSTPTLAVASAPAPTLEYEHRVEDDQLSSQDKDHLPPLSDKDTYKGG